MKMKLRKSVLFFLLLTFVAPIILYTDTLGFYFTPSSPRNEFLEDVSAFTFAGEVRPLNVLPQESSASLREPLGVVYSENSIHSSSSHTEASSGESTRITRQLTEESAEDGTENSSTLSRGSNEQSLDGNRNSIRQVIDTIHETEVVIGKGTSDKIKSRDSVGIAGGRSVWNEEIKSLHSDGCKYLVSSSTIED